MVKPPRTMQPESMDLSVADSATSKAFQPDSFHIYMARKIDLQRQQFGQAAGLPPAPVLQSLKDSRPFSLKPSLMSPSPTRPVAKKSQSVRFAPVELDNDNNSFEPKKRRRRLKAGHDINEESTEIDSMIQRLQRQHPKLSKRVNGRKRKRQKVRKVAEVCIKEVLEEEDMVPGGGSEPFASLPQNQSPKIQTHTNRRNSRPDLFLLGVVIKVNGYTNPDNENLKRMVQKHGGDYEVYETDRVTHIIAEHLSTAKGEIYKRQRNPQPVVSPKWIVDCISQQRLLPHADYLLQEVKAKGQGKGIKEMFEASSLYFEPKSNEQGISKDVLVAAAQSPRMEHLSPSNLTGKHSDGRVRTVGNDPNFLESFFRESRLSFIGSYKQRVNSSPSKVSRKNLDHLDRFVFHIDMDCFFASVVLRNFPEYRNAPVVICHFGKGGIRKNVPKTSTSECATCNYEARKYGIKKGMFLGRAKELCPDLVALPYEMQEYTEVAERVSEILNNISADHHGNLEIVSCDESYLQLFLAHNIEAASVGEEIRTEIFQQTECTASVGVARNKLLAKLATAKAKPNGCFVVEDPKLLLKTLKLKDLPGIGYKREPKLVAKGLVSVQDVWEMQSSGIDASSVLCDVLGTGVGMRVFEFCQGEDNRKVEPSERKTIGAECNYGVRFDGPYGIDHFMRELAKEVQRRMEGVGVKGLRITLKAKKRKKGAKPPPKFLGHGSCHNLSKSMDIPGSNPVSDAKVIRESGIKLFQELGIPLEDLRGMGIIMSRLVDDEEVTMASNDLKHWFEKVRPGENDGIGPTPNIAEDVHNLSRDPWESQTSRAKKVEVPEMDENHTSFSQTEIALPPMSQIRMSQVEQLPFDMQEQIQAQMRKKNKINGEGGKDISWFGFESKTTDPKTGTKPPKKSISCDKIMTNQLHQTSMTQILRLAADVCDDTRVDGLAMKNANSHINLSVKTTQPSTYLHVDQKERPSNVFEEDILPLNHFLDENSCREPQALQLVITFLKICLKEGRSKDVITMLRSIKSRIDDWSDDVILSEVAREVDSEYLKLHGSRLDIDRILAKMNLKKLS